MMKMLRRLLPLMLVFAMGCGDGRVKLPTASVSGTVTYRGKPLGGGRIALYHSSGQAAAANISPKGEFQLAAFQGKNQVTIQCYESEDPASGPLGTPPGMKPVKCLIPQRYTEFASSGLTLDVKPDANPNADFVLKD